MPHLKNFEILDILVHVT